MNIGSPTQYTDFTRDVLGRYVGNTFDEALVTIDPNARNAAGLPPRGDLRPFDFIVVGGGTFGTAVAEHLWFRSRNRSERILVLDGGPFLLPEHVQNLPVLGLNAGDAVTHHAPQKEVWGLAWNAAIPFPGLAYCLGGRSVYWGGWSPRLLDSELPTNVWPQAVLDDLRPKTLPDNRKGYFRQASDQIGVTETNDFIFGELHHAMRAQLVQGLTAGNVRDAMNLAALPDHPAVEYRDTPASLDDLAALLGIPSPTPPPVNPGDRATLEAKLRNAAKVEAPLAVQGQAGHAGFFPFNKFSTVPLLIKAAREAYAESPNDDVRKRLMVVPRCHVIRLNTVVEAAGRRVTEVVTERGPIPVSPGALDGAQGDDHSSVRLALLSFGSDGKIGTNLMAHLRSNVDIRIPRAALTSLPGAVKALEASALFVKGRHQFTKADGSPDGFGHFHFQITASGLGAGGSNSEAELFKKIPDIDTFDAHKHASDTLVVITIRGIGEMQPDNGMSNVTLDLNPQQNDEFQTRRAWVNLQPTLRDQELWNAMDKASDDIALIFANGEKIDVLANQQVIATNVDPHALATILPYKSSDASGPGRRDGLGTTHHEAGTLRFGDNASTSVTNANCRFHDLTNAYVAGPALFPTIGSPNPMLTGIALARRLGDHLIPAPPAQKLEAGFTSLFDGKEDPAVVFTKWLMVGGGRFIVREGALVAQPGNGIGLLYYGARQFDDFTLRLDFYLPHPRGNANDNSGVFVRFRDPRKPVLPGTPGPDVPGNLATVAVDTGYEVQIDEEARGDTRKSETDGHFFNRTGAIYKITGLGTALGQQNYANNQSLPSGVWHAYEIKVTGRTYEVTLDGQPATAFTADPADPVERFRGRKKSEDPDSGFIGIQTHTGTVAFANIRIRE